MRTLTYSAIENYRKGSHKHKSLPLDVLKARMNALIDASEYYDNVIGGKRYHFGQCMITVKFNMITDIKWNRNKKVIVSSRQTSKMFKAFNNYGLNKSGTKFVEVI